MTRWPFLWQFPPNFAFEPTRFARLVALLPRSIDDAVARAATHDARVQAPWFEPVHRGPLRTRAASAESCGRSEKHLK